MSLRFHLDEHVALAVAGALRRRGMDVSSTPESGLRGATDLAHLSFASATQRVIYTEGADFLSLAAARSDHSGIVYSAPGSRSLRQVIEFLVLLDACLTAEDMRGQVEFVPHATS